MSISGWLSKRKEARQRLIAIEAADSWNQARRSHGWAIWTRAPGELELVEVRSNDRQTRYFFRTETGFVYSGRSGTGFSRRDTYALLTMGKLNTDQAMVDLASRRSLNAAVHLGEKV